MPFLTKKYTNNFILKFLIPILLHIEYSLKLTNSLMLNEKNANL
jgi:hypothetical protein